MANNKYQRSVKRERELVNEARAAGCLAARSAGSKSPIDVWSWDKANKTVTITQVKTKKGARSKVVSTVEMYDNVKLIYNWVEYV